MKLLNRKLDVPTIVAFDHDLGGGATAYLVEKDVWLCGKDTVL